ncbi:16S rRNA (cytidine(1402)-2'-O)-methyltransferase [bacterium]|nr:16S rRNA (cytidine(1402)-2'-O)-methyltransferase [bacterium]MDC1212100.1 16S rRNA (cytidine(1402)-2'-O)-methyltransferase [bacterium]MDC1221792.1 16S rRNA (cytidine(1402)-2'-O)-methyltransferase [Salibacteraceae bacterium]
MTGKLTLVPTPIGNLDDITLRAIKVLGEADAILCEDTRHSGKLLAHHNISNKLQPFHQHNEHKVTDRLVADMEAGTTYALVTDAGTPGISDPGFLLVRASIEAGIQVEVLPGATAIIPAIVGSGFSSEKYVYLGFPPQKKGRQTFWKELTEEAKTMVMYESPHRINKALREALETFGPERQACVAREISKLYETYHRGTTEELLALGEEKAYKGEIVLMIEGKNQFEKRMKA